MIIVLIASIIHFLFWLSHGVETYPDSVRYLNQGKFPPFNLRWLLPRIMNGNTLAWQITTGIATVLIPVAMFYFLESWHLAYMQCVIGGLLTIGLKGVFGFNVHVPVLVDSVAMLLMVISATLFNYGMITEAVIVVVVAGMIKESTPIFTTLVTLQAFPFNLILLIGLVPVAIAYLFGKKDEHDMLGEKSEDTLRHPLKYGFMRHDILWLNHNLWLSWGVCWLAFLHPSYHLFAIFIVAFLQMFIATDSVRLWHWAFPVVVLYAVPNIPIELGIIAVVIQWINPFGRNIV